jgi:hypothetical protein
MRNIETHLLQLSFYALRRCSRHAMREAIARALRTLPLRSQRIVPRSGNRHGVLTPKRGMRALGSGNAYPEEVFGVGGVDETLRMTSTGQGAW